jgi:hypothetical protein
MEILRGMRVYADQGIQLLTSGTHKIDNTPAILDRVKASRDEIDRLITNWRSTRERA